MIKLLTIKFFYDIMKKIIKVGSVMKKFSEPATKIFAVLSAICFLMIIVGIVFAVSLPAKTDLIFFFLGFGIPLFILSLTVFIACAFRNIVIDEEKIIFAYKRKPVFFNEIKRVPVKHYNGDKPSIFLVILFAIIFHDALGGTKEYYSYTFYLNDGTEFTEHFYSYGKKQEREIVAKLKEKNIRFV